MITLKSLLSFSHECTVGFSRGLILCSNFIALTANGTRCLCILYFKDFSVFIPNTVTSMDITHRNRGPLGFLIFENIKGGLKSECTDLALRPPHESISQSLAKGDPSC